MASRTGWLCQESSAGATVFSGTANMIALWMCRESSEEQRSVTDNTDTTRWQPHTPHTGAVGSVRASTCRAAYQLGPERSAHPTHRTPTATRVCVPGSATGTRQSADRRHHDTPDHAHTPPRHTHTTPHQA